MELEFNGKIILSDATSEQIDRKIKDVLIQKIEDSSFFDNKCIDFMNKNNTNEYMVYPDDISDVNDEFIIIL